MRPTPVPFGFTGCDPRDRVLNRASRRRLDHRRLGDAGPIQGGQLQSVDWWNEHSWPG